MTTGQRRRLPSFCWSQYTPGYLIFRVYRKPILKLAQAAALIEGLPTDVVMADTAYDADHLRQAIAAKGALAVIPNNPSRALKYPLDKHLYAQRHLVECCFSKLKQLRRVATRFEKTARNYRAVVTLAAIILWMLHTT